MLRTFVLGVLLVACVVEPVHGQEANGFVRPEMTAAPDLFVWTDTCNVYVLRDGESALLIDLGDGSVLDRLAEIGVKRVDWLLFTHHHREQVQGAPKLDRGKTKVAGPEGEQGLFERPTNYRRMKVRLNDPFTIHGTSYVRPTNRPIVLDRAIKPGETFRWGKHEISCVGTPGNSPAALTYVVELGGKKLAFSGDVMLDGAKMHTWFDTEWDYGFAAGIRALRKSVATLTELKADRMLPSHGPTVGEPTVQLERYAEKLARLEKLYVRGYGAEAASNAYQDKVSKATPIKDLAQVSPHLFKFKRANFWPNFNLILSDSGRAILVDCGLLNPEFLDETLEQMRKQYGLKAIDAVVVTHMHGDHFLQAPHVRNKWGAQVWALENMVEKMEHPERFDYPAPVQAYGAGLDGVKVDRALKPGESIRWEGYTFTIDWMPGQTEFALAVQGMIDGRKVVFTGDNIFGDPDDVAQTGHEAMVAHNSAILEEGYIHGAELLARIKPDVIVGGHSFVMGNPAAFIERYRRWAYEMRDLFRELSPDPDYEYFFDPYWVRAYPYRSSLKPGESTDVTLNVRNFRSGAQKHRIVLDAPPGVRIEPAVLEGEIPAESRGAFPVRVTLSPDAERTNIVTLDVTLDDKRYGQMFDFVVGVTDGP